MPPKCKFSREEIVEAALSITRRDGPEAVTARSLGKWLGSSARPIFSVFSSMEEVRLQTLEAARRVYATYVEQAFEQREMPIFKGVGMQYIRFSLEEPQLFSLLFMSRGAEKPDVQYVLPLIEENYERILRSVRESYDLDEKAAQVLYCHLWIYTHGIAVLCATNLCSFTSEQMGNMLTQVCRALLREIGGGKYHD